MLRIAATTLVAFLTIATSSLAAAQDGTVVQQANVEDEAARLTFEAGRNAFNAGDYDTALARFQQAYQLSRRAGLLYNIAQTFDRLRRDCEALGALRDYLNAEPSAPNRAEVEARIRVLQSQDPCAGDAPPPPSAHTTVPTQERPPLHPAFFISAAGVALVAGGLAVWTGLETISLNDRYLSDQVTTIEEAEPLYDEAKTYELMTNVFIGVGAAFGAGALAMAFFTDWGAFTGEMASLRPSFWADNNGAWLGASGSF